jgi:biopolymer transport protein TolR
MKTGHTRTALAEINVTPLVDVMLVLLIILMVTAPLMQQGIDVNLPKAKGKELPPEERISIVIRNGGAIFLNDNPISERDMIGKLSSIRQRNQDVFLKADQDVPYGTVVEIMDAIKEAGIEKLGMVTEPKISSQ